VSVKELLLRCVC